MHDTKPVTGPPAGSCSPAQQYTIVVAIADSIGVGNGENDFDIIANSGSCSTTDANAEVNAPASGAEASANDAVLPMYEISWTVVWTAPASGDAQIDVWAVMGVGAAGNHDIWDHGTCACSVIPESHVPLAPVLGVVVAIVLASWAMKR